jgi:hypothetical protein
MGDSTASSGTIDGGGQATGRTDWASGSVGTIFAGSDHIHDPVDSGGTVSVTGVGQG